MVTRSRLVCLPEWLVGVRLCSRRSAGRLLSTNLSVRLIYVTGLQVGDYCVVFGQPEANEKVLGILATRGFPQEALKGRASVLAGKPVATEMLSEIGATFQQALDAGAPLIRLLGNIGWGHPDWPAENDLLQFESQVTDACRTFPCVVVCMYDVKSLSGRAVVRGGVESHPSTILSTGIEKNPHFVPAAQYLARYLKKKS